MQLKQTARLACNNTENTTGTASAASDCASTTYRNKATRKSHEMQIITDAEVICKCNNNNTNNNNNTENNHNNDTDNNKNNKRIHNSRSRRCNMLSTDVNVVDMADTSSGRRCTTTIADAAEDPAAQRPRPARRQAAAGCWRSISPINSSLNKMLTLALVLLLVTWCDLTHAALRNVNLFIEPPAVRRGQSVVLRCQYSLEGATLYSVKFYRGQLEFYRYTPAEYPNTKVLPYAAIKVDESASNATQVVIRNVSFGLTGNFSCEVTADAPLFSTATAYAQMQVVEFPEKRPQLFTDQSRYEPGDVLRANCSTPPSRPRAELRFTINNRPILAGEPLYIRTLDNLIASRLSLKLQLQSSHFAAGPNAHMINALGAPGSGLGVPYNTLNTGGGGALPTGGLVLRCTAQIGDLYQEYKEIELGTPQKDPVPARVTLSSGSSFSNFFESYFSSAAAAPITPTAVRHVLTASLAAVLLGAFQAR